MSDPRENPYPLERILEICKEIDIEVVEHSPKLGGLKRFSAIEDTDSNSLSFVNSREILLKNFENIKGIVLLSSEALKNIDRETIHFDYIAVNEPKYLFAFLYKNFQERFAPESHEVKEIEKRDSDSLISSTAVIDAGVQIGKRVEIESGVRIFRGTIIGDDVKVGSNSVLGGVGFGFAVRKGYPALRIPHLGRLLIGNRVEIGNGTHIDRGTFLATVISDDVKIDNSVHIAHNVFIGKRTLVIAHAEISGSVQIGDDCWIAPNVSIKEKVKIGNNALVGIGSVVLSDVESNQVVVGVPARPIATQG